MDDLISLIIHRINLYFVTFTSISPIIEIIVCETRDNGLLNIPFFSSHHQLFFGTILLFANYILDT